jgi:urea ABC transporter ATP-binding protein UrtE
MSFLHVEKVHASYGHAPVLRGVSMELRSNEILSLLGRNGVGKTTLMRLLIGLLKPSQGQVKMDGQVLSNLPPHRIARQGISYVPQGRGIFPKLTVGENLILGTRSTGEKRPPIPEEVFVYFPILKERIKQLGGSLSGGQQQMLAIGRALCGKPKIVLLDEPSEGIQPNIVQQIGDLILEIAESTNISFLVVEQNLDLALRVAHRCMIMNMGQIVFEGEPSEFEDDMLIKKHLAI